MEDRDLSSLNAVELEEAFDEAFGELLDAIAEAGEDHEAHINPHWDICEEHIEEIEWATWQLAPQPY